ncbi:MAG: hypothetical protein WBG86_04585 [Polyangiales bacterium]
MDMRCDPRLVSALIALVAFGCTGRKQVPFGLEEPDGSVEVSAEDGAAEAPDAGLPVGERFDGGQVEVALDERTMVVQEGYALAALRVDLDDDDAFDMLVVTTTPEQVRLVAGFPRGMTVEPRAIDTFLVPADCVEAEADLHQLSPSLVSARVRHRCDTGTRENVWILSVEAQPRVRERVTILPGSHASAPPIAISVLVRDEDGDQYDDVVVETKVGETEVPLTWLNRPGGFARDTSQPEATFEALANEAGQTLASNARAAEAAALGVLEAFRALCRESGETRIGLSGTLGIQCQRSPGAARASTIAAVAAIEQGRYVDALEQQRWWARPATMPSPEDRAKVARAWQKARASSAAQWELVTTSATAVPLFFTDSNTLVVGGANPRKVQLSTGLQTAIPPAEILPPIRDPNGRFFVTGVRVTCAGSEAEIRPALGKQTHRVTIERAPSKAPCKTPIDRAAGADEWSVLGWAPQGLVAGMGDRLRIVPLSASGKPAGQPFELDPGRPLPAPVRGARITPDGGRYVIPHREGLIVRDWKTGATGLWLRPGDWDGVPGEVRSVAISPDGKRIALQKGSEIRLLTW